MSASPSNRQVDDDRAPPRHARAVAGTSKDPDAPEHRPPDGRTNRMTLRPLDHEDQPGRRPSRRLGRALVLSLALATAATTMGTPVSAAPPRPAATPNFGPNVTIFDPSMPVGQIQATLDATHAKQVDNEMGTERYA